MWALAIYDAVEEKIFLARDRFGVKPLYYCNSPSEFVFGSEIKQLLAVQPEVRANRRVVIESLLTSIDGYSTETFFEGVKSFPPSHCGIYDLREHSLEIERYYQLAPEASLQSLSLQDAVTGFRNLFEDAVRIRLRSDVRVGTCLSGGLDSSATSTVASRLNRLTTPEPFIGIHAKSIDAERDESEFARLAAQHAGIELHFVEPRTEDFVATIDELIDTHEEPFGSPSMFMGWHVFQKAKALGCKVMLNGQGGDEALLGYERYFAAFLRSVPFRYFLREALAQARNSRLSLKDVLLYNFYFTSPFLRIQSLKRRSYLRREIKDAYDFEIVRRSVNSFRNLEELQIFEISTVQLPHLLRYEDRNSMRHSIETRLPFLDYRVVEFAISISPQHKIQDGWTKFVLRRGMDTVLPSQVTWRRDKIGFEAPERTWIGSSLERMKREIAASRILSQIAEHDRLLAEFDSLPLRRKWSYFMIAAWERRFGVAW
jgi:asparagine synthase (glutamine-hydrolysing)